MGRRAEPDASTATSIFTSADDRLVEIGRLPISITTMPVLGDARPARTEHRAEPNGELRASRHLQQATLKADSLASTPWR